MNDHDTLHCFRYKIKLLEDLHAGSGLGSVWVDRSVVRDANGQPFIPASHVKGVWRDVAVRLALMGIDGFDDATITAWFGAGPKHANDTTSPTRGRLHCPTLKLLGNGVETIVWMQSARQPDSRRPADDTLHSTEYLPANTNLEGYGLFKGTDRHFAKLRELVNRVDRYGANRSRGDGKVQCLEFEVNNLKAPDNINEVQAEHGIRLLLEALAPVQVPRTGSPGNIIESETRLPGRMLSGAITREMLDGNVEAALLFGAAAHVGDALPLDPLTPVSAGDLDRLDVLPAPLEYRVEKPPVKPGVAFHHLPPWASANNSDQTLCDWKDLIALKDKDSSLKRLPSETYVQRIGSGPWRAFRQSLELAMRNRRGSDVKEGKMDEALFSSEQMPAGTRFVADILPGAAADWAKWLDALKTLLAATPLLFIGRGGAPVQIVAVSRLKQEPRPQAANPPNSFRLTLTSDAIIRAAWLGFHQRLTLQALFDAIDVDCDQDTHADDVSESGIDRAFNAATGLPRPSVMVLKRGSSIIVTGGCASKLHQKLLGLKAIGERQHEGMGRFRLDLDLGIKGDRLPQAEFQAKVAAARSEDIARFASELHEKHKKALSDPSRSQLGNLRAAFDALPPEDSGPKLAGKITNIREGLAETASRTSGGKVFERIAAEGGLLTKLAAKCRDEAWSADDIRLALRLTVAQLSREERDRSRATEQQKPEVEA